MKDLFQIVEEQGYCLIAEIGVNYYDIATKMGISTMEAAKLMCKEAAESGCDAVKFQTYKAGKIASKFSPSYWDTTEEPTTSQYELFQKFDAFGEAEYRELKDYCDEIGTIFMSTPFDFEAADYLNSMMDYYKISSSDLTNIPFIEHMCKFGKPILLSTGASNEEEIERAVDTVKKYGNKLVLLHCVLEYPTPYEHANLLKIQALKEYYPDIMIGYSDHTKPDQSSDVLKTAYSLGAVVMEKHFTLDKTLKGNDHYHAMDPDDVRNIKAGLDRIRMICGSKSVNALESESAARANARRSIVLLRDVKAGEKVTKEDVTFKRPGIGISPSEVENVIGKVYATDLEEDTILKWEMLQ